MPKIDALKLMHAHEMGAMYARNLMPGLVFLGAGPAAQAKGYERGTPEYSMFIGAALDILEHKRIVTDKHNKIVSVEAR